MVYGFNEELYRYDTRNMRSILLKFAEQVIDSYNLIRDLSYDPDFSRIVICGMGGSGIAGELIKDLIGRVIEVIVVHDYSLPDYIGEESLVFVVSYSGNTEETLSCFKDAIKKTKRVVTLSKGGELEKLAKTYNKPHIKLPPGLLPREAILYLTIPILKVLENSGVLSGLERELKDVASQINRWRIEERAIELSELAYRKNILIYAVPLLRAVGYRWKTQFNENSKVLAFFNTFSEFNHNELEALHDGNNHVFILNSNLSIEKMKRRVQVVKDLILESKIPVTEITIKGSLLAQQLILIHLGDFTSYYLALRNRVDPSTTSKIALLKDRLGRFTI